MGAPKRPCPRCQAPSEAGMFCSQCGAKVPDPKRTVMGLPQAQLRPPAADGVSAAQAPPEPAPVEAPPSAPVAPVASAVELPTPGARGSTGGRGMKGKGGVRNRTMMGMGASPFGPAAAAGPVQAPPGTPADPAPPPSPSPAPIEAPSAPVPSPTPPSSPGAARSNRTMLGMPLVPERPPSEPPQPAPTSGGPMGAKTHRTMLGLTPPGAPQIVPAEPAAAQAVPSSRQRAPVEYGATLDLPARRSSRALLLAGGALVVVAFALFAVAAFVWFGAGPALEATIVRGERGEALRIRAPEALEGSKVRFAGVELPLVDGTATFPIASRVLHIGDNEIDLALVAPDGEVQDSQITLTVNFRIRADLSHLGDTVPAIDVVVDVVPGTAVTLDAAALTVDENGHGSRRFALPDPAAGAAFEHAVAFGLVFADGRTEAGTLSTRVPFATLQVERPGERLVTDARSVVIAGVVGNGATARVDGREVEVTEGRFSVPFAMAEPGTFSVPVTARQPGTLPRTRVVQIRRVASLRREAARFRADRGMTYAAIRDDPNAHRGERIALTGRVYNVNPDAGRTVLQVFVRPCATDDPCTLWVTYPAVTDAAVGTDLRILGVVAGQQQFRTQSNRVVTVPRVDAEILLPLRRR